MGLMSGPLQRHRLFFWPEMHIYGLNEPRQVCQEDIIRQQVGLGPLSSGSAMLQDSKQKASCIQKGAGP